MSFINLLEKYITKQKKFGCKNAKLCEKILTVTCKIEDSDGEPNLT
jgi:hypothetical protein